MNDADTKEKRITLELLDAIERGGDISQRNLANQMGVALGLTNSYLKRCAKKGLVKIREAPANRYFYYLTPKGFAEKSRLTAQFLSGSLSFYRQSAESVTDLYLECQRNGWAELIMCGASDLAEIAMLRVAGTGLNVVGVYEPVGDGTDFLGHAMYRQLDTCPPADAYLITGLDDPLEMFNSVIRYVGNPERVLVPAVLGIDRSQQIAQSG